MWMEKARSGWNLFGQDFAASSIVEHMELMRYQRWFGDWVHVSNYVSTKVAI